MSVMSRGSGHCGDNLDDLDCVFAESCTYVLITVYKL